MRIDISGRAVPERRRRELVDDGGVDLGVVPALLLDDEAVPAHDLHAEDGGEVLAVHHVLHLGRDEAAGLLVQNLVLWTNAKTGFP